jgi:hypothetical protein
MLRNVKDVQKHYFRRERGFQETELSTAKLLGNI